MPEQESSDKATGAFIGGMLVGVAMGAIAGLLSAPQNGQTTRKRIKDSADALPDLVDDVSTTVQFYAEQLTESSLNRWDQTLLRVRNAITTGLIVSEQERQRIARSRRKKQPTSPERNGQS
ncbi:MAG: YtxH domain-containing protein [Merismopedia sp. SIO2A8]|nr:YtxH domain-containing protein [Merismopedia sp. SIO2A8]